MSMQNTQPLTCDARTVTRWRTRSSSSIDCSSRIIAANGLGARWSIAIRLAPRVALMLPPVVVGERLTTVGRGARAGTGAIAGSVVRVLVLVGLDLVELVGVVLGGGNGAGRPRVMADLEALDELVAHTLVDGQLVA